MRKVLQDNCFNEKDEALPKMFDVRVVLPALSLTNATAALRGSRNIAWAKSGINIHGKLKTLVRIHLLKLPLCLVRFHSAIFTPM